jgi:hypothetical protein
MVNPTLLRNRRAARLQALDRCSQNGVHCPSMNDSSSRLLSERLSNQRLTRTAFRKAADVVAWFGAVQSQDYAGAKWALGQRAIGLTDAAIDRAFDEGAILRTHILRPTWHFVAPADLRWMMTLSGPRVNVRCASYFRKLEMDSALFSRSLKVIERALEGGHQLTRTELQKALARAKIAVGGIRLAFVVMRAELDCVICSGGRRGRHFTYALFDERVPAQSALERDEALARLTARFFGSHGPATIRDFVWWSGLTVKDAQTGIAAARPALAQQELDGRKYWFVPSKTPLSTASPTSFLLPNYDEYLVAYKDRDPAVANVIAQRVMERKFDAYAHMLVLNGKLAGTWRREVSKGSVHVSVLPFARLTSRDKRSLDDATSRFARFLETPVNWSA